jgi:hypothetical protein
MLRCILALIVFALTCPTATAQLKKLRTGTTIGELKSINPAKNTRDTILEVLSPGEEKPRRYTVGAHQKDILVKVKSAKAGERVQIEWYDTVEGLCVDKFEALAAAGARRTGVITGVVTDKGDSKQMNNAWVQIRADGEEGETLLEVNLREELTPQEKKDPKKKKWWQWRKK